MKVTTIEAAPAGHQRFGVCLSTEHYELDCRHLDHGDRCGTCQVACEQWCGRPATVYAIDPHPGGWGGRYCERCVKALKFQVTDRLEVK